MVSSYITKPSDFYSRYYCIVLASKNDYDYFVPQFRTCITPLSHRYDYTTSYPEAERDNLEEELDLVNLDDSGFELVLPSGAKVGHRSLVR